MLTAYGAYGPKKLYGKQVVGVIRSTFVIDAEGLVEKAVLQRQGHRPRRQAAARPRPGLTPARPARRDERAGSRCRRGRRCPPAHGDVVLRPFEPGDVALVRELSTDPYVPAGQHAPAVGHRGAGRGVDRRNRGRWADGVGYSFAVAEAATGAAVGQCGLWLAELPEVRASAGT